MESMLWMWMGEFRSLVTVRSPRICMRCRDPYLHVPDMYIV
jgi:hypothetical protein